MATFPSNIKFKKPSFTEDRGSAVVSTKMERGVPKTRRKNSDVLVEMKIEMTFATAAEYANFEAWFDSSTGAGSGANWFSMTHPRTGAAILAQFKDGQLGMLKPSTNAWPGPADREATIVFMEAAY